MKARGGGGTRAPFQIRACDGVAEEPKSKLEGIRHERQLVKDREKRKANGRFWLGLSGWRTTNVLHKRDVQGAVAWCRWVGVGSNGEGQARNIEKMGVEMDLRRA